MTAHRTDFEDIVRGAVAGPGGPYSFFEERIDLRVNLSSSGSRDIAETRSRGAAFPGARSAHVTDIPHMPPSEAGIRVPALWDPMLEDAIVEGATRAAAGRRHPLWAAKVVSFHQEVWVTALDGEVLQDTRRSTRVEIRVGVGGERSASAVEELVLRSGEPHTLMEAFVRAFDRAEVRRSGCVPPARGTTAAVFAPGVAGVVAHELVGHALEGDVVLRGATWVQVLTDLKSPRPLSVIDDPRLGRGAWSIDDEGVSTGATPLIDRGRPVGLLLDGPTAKALDRNSTGHGRRSSYLERVRPRMGCTFITAGVDAPEDILRATPKGVFIRRMAGGHTDPRTGRASFVVSDADRIVDGRCEETLDPFILTIDGAEAWRSIDLVAHDLAFDTCIGSCVRDGQPIAVSVGAPTIRIGVVNVVS